MYPSKASSMPLAPFQAWLISHGRSPRTATLYADRVRSIFRTPDEARRLIGTPAELCGAIEMTDVSLRPASRRPFRAAWRAFDAFLRERKLITESILPSFGRVIASSDLDREDHPLTPLLRELFERSRPQISWDRVPFLCWKDVRGDFHNPELTIHDHAWGRSYRVWSDLLQRIAAWAGGGDLMKARGLPFIPAEPLSRTPMPGATLRKLACR